ncbi:MAG TPA: glycosyltransferase family 4 protein [Anaerolineales bacterium]|nr:glycosyltransferase family 4 protein [Anaerolineales bacterium]HLO28424.1 glycosyltransferase family 4 protein [Anaerolineales bacterium]
MQQLSLSQTKDLGNSVQAKTLLFVGPKPPPIGGSPLTVQAMLEELAFYPSVRVKLISTSPGLDVRKKMTGFNFEKVWRSIVILPKYMYEIPGCDAVLVFANDLFAITLVPLLLFWARLFRKPFYLKPVGAGLDLYIKAQKKIFREYLLRVLRATDGILTQTQLLSGDLHDLGCSNAYYLPGCRPLAPIVPIHREEVTDLRLIFLGHITRLKGPLVLLEALRYLPEICDQKVTCDFYGPIHDDMRAEFWQGLKATPNAHYCGVTEPGTGPQLISEYDALVLPTYYDTEGHPGVIIEAMHAGVPVISTQVRTFPELITNGINGFLVPTKDSRALAEAIYLLAVDPGLAKKMGQANHLKGREFSAEIVVAQMLKIIFPPCALIREQA